MRRLPISIASDLKLELLLLYKAKRNTVLLLLTALVFATYRRLCLGTLGQLLSRLDIQRRHQLHFTMIRRGCIYLSYRGLSLFREYIGGPHVELGPADKIVFSICCEDLHIWHCA